MNLADHRIAGHAFAELASDLAGAQAFHPKFLEKFDAIVGPAIRLRSGNHRQLRILCSAAKVTWQPFRLYGSYAEWVRHTRYRVPNAYDLTTSAESGSRVGAVFPPEFSG